LELLSYYQKRIEVLFVMWVVVVSIKASIVVVVSIKARIVVVVSIKARTVGRHYLN